MSELIVQDHALVKAEIDMQITTAKSYPRDVDRFLKEAIAMATIDQETAESCIYALPRGKDGEDQKFVKGASVRLAEICASGWGNLHIASRTTANDGKTITAEAVAWDLEKNLKIGKEVKRSIVNKFGRVFTADMQVVTGNAAASIAMRNAIFSVIPKAFVNRVYEAAVSHAVGDQTKLSDRTAKIVDRFKKMGIQESKILTYFGKKSISEITADETVEMIGIGTAIKEGNLNIDQAFVLQEAVKESKASSLNEVLSKKKEEVKPQDDEWNKSFDEAKTL